MRLAFIITHSNGTQTLSSDVPVPVGQWSRVSAGVRSGRVFVAVEAEEKSAPLDGDIGYHDGDVVWGTGFVGGIDEIKLFDLLASPLTTFSGGSTEIVVTADVEGKAVAEFSSTGTWASSGPAQVASLAHSSAFGFQDPSQPVLLEEIANQKMEITIEYFERSDATGWKAYVFLVTDALPWYFFRIIKSATGHPDDIVTGIVGMIFAIVAIAPFAAYDIVVQGEKTYKSMGDAFSVIALVGATIDIAAIVLKNRLRPLTAVRRLSRVHRAAKPIRSVVLSRMLLDVLNKITKVGDDVDDFINIRRLLESTDQQVVAAVSEVIKRSVKSHDDLVKLETVLSRFANADEAMLELSRLAGRVGRLEVSEIAFRRVLETVAECASCGNRLTAKGLTALTWAAENTIELASGPRAIEMNKLVSFVKYYDDDPVVLFDKVGDLVAASRADPDIVKGMGKVLEDLGSGMRSRSGATKVLNVAHSILANPHSVAKLKGFEQKAVINALRNVLPQGSNVRVHDLLIEEGGRLIRCEVKNWLVYPADGALFKAVDQMLKDVVDVVARGGQLSDIRWFIPQYLANTPVRQVFIDNVLAGDEILIEGLKELGRLADLPTIQRRFAELVEDSTIFRFVPD
jgi:hypothetical protein